MKTAQEPGTLVNDMGIGSTECLMSDPVAAPAAPDKTAALPPAKPCPAGSSQEKGRK